MAIDVTQLSEYSWSDIATAAKQAMITAAIGGSMLRIKGREIERITIDQATALYAFAQEQAALEAGGASPGIALIRWGEAQ